MPRKKSFEDTIESARDAAVRLLARREHGAREMRQKLQQRGYSVDVIDDAIAELIERDWLSDCRYAASMARHRASQGKGPRWVRTQLQSAGVPADAVEPALQQAELDWFQACADAALRMYRPGRADAGARLRQKLYQRGFDSEQISFALKRLKQQLELPAI